MYGSCVTVSLRFDTLHSQIQYVFCLFLEFKEVYLIDFYAKGYNNLAVFLVEKGVRYEARRTAHFTSPVE